MYQHFDSAVKPIIGKTLLRVERTDTYKVDFHFTDGSKSTLQVTGDCCSVSIFYAIVLPQGLWQGVAQVTGAKTSDSYDLTDEIRATVKAVDPDFYFEYDSLWDVVISTTAGDIRICHINSSNGYYDGYTEWFHSDAAPEKRTGLTITGLN